MKSKFIKRFISGVITAAVAVSSIPMFSVSSFAAESEIQKYEFENGSTSGGEIHTEGWKGNTLEDGTGEDFDLTNASGGFSYLDQKGTTVSIDVTVEEAGLYELSFVTVNLMTQIKRYSI